MAALIAVLGVALTGALVVVGFVALRREERARKVQRVIDLHRDLTTGEVGASRDRLTTLMWKHGEKVARRNQCHAPTWIEILPSSTGSGGPTRGALGSYPLVQPIPGTGEAEPMRDLYSVLWCFERVNAGRAGGALDPAMLQQLIASHAIWWDEMTRNLTEQNTRHIASLRSLASALNNADLRDWARRDFAAAPDPARP